MTKSSRTPTPHEQAMFHHMSPSHGRLAYVWRLLLAARNAGLRKPRGRFWPARKESLGSRPWSVMREAVGHDRYGAILNGRCDVGFANRDPVYLATMRAFDSQGHSPRSCQACGIRLNAGERLPSSGGASEGEGSHILIVRGGQPGRWIAPARLSIAAHTPIVGKQMTIR
jgi:hypothetical protein